MNEHRLDYSRENVECSYMCMSQNDTFESAFECNLILPDFTNKLIKAIFFKIIYVCVIITYHIIIILYIVYILS